MKDAETGTDGTDTDSNSSNDLHCCSCYDTHCEGTCCGKCLERCKNASDFIRMIAAELILYPLLVCDIFELVTGEGYKGESTADRVSFALFIISSLALILYVYIVRLFILGSTIHHVQKSRKPPIEDQTTHQQADCNPQYRKAALWFQSHFFIHVFGQMVSQILMLIAIGAKIRYDNRHLFESDNNDDEIRVSPYLWYMLVAGYIMPVCGLLTFFIVNYYWVQEFPIGLCIDILSLLELPGVDHILRPDKELKDSHEKAKRIMRFVHFAELKKDFKGMHGKDWCNKFMYPFSSPILVFLCIVYSICLLFFIIFATLAVSDDGDTMTVVLNGGNWVYFYIGAIIFGIIVNTYVFVVTIAWMIIIGAVILLITVLVWLIVMIMLFVCLIYCLSDSGNNRRQ